MPHVMSIRTGCLAAALVVAAGVVHAQKGARTLVATGEFRCEAGGCGVVDRVRDDGLAYDFYIKASGEGSQLNGNGEYYLFLQTGGQNRALVVDLGDKVSGALCEPNCHYQQGWNGATVIDIYDGWLRTNVLEPDGVTELKGGLLALPCGTPRDSRMLITFTNATQTSSNATKSITLRWYADAFPPSNMVTVTRHTRTTFTIEAADGAANAVVVGSALVRGRFLSDTRQEGVFNMPFLVNVTVPEAPAKAGCTD